MKKLIMTIIALAILPQSSFTATTLEQQEIETQKLDERLTDLELHATLDRLHFGSDMKVEMTHMNDTVKFLDNNTRSKDVHLIGGVLFHLNADAAISNELKLFATAESFSFFNQSLFNSRPDLGNRELQAKGEGLVISKAYFDWEFYKKWLIFSAGRLPTTRGPPAYFKDGVPREGTYPVTAFSIPLDGFALTAKLNRALDFKDNLSFRFIYSPGGVVNGQFPYRGVNQGDYTHPENKQQEHKIFSGMLEYEQTKVKNIPWKSMLAIVQYTYFNTASFPLTQASGLLGPTDIDQYKLYFTNPRNLDVKLLSTYLEFQKIAQSQFDFYATAAFAISNSPTHVGAVKIAGPGAVPAGTVLDLGETLHGGTSKSTRFMLGTCYEFADQYFAGTEFMNASKKAVGTAFYSNNIFNPNFLTGTSYELYTYKRMYNNNFIVRLGFTHVDVRRDITNGLSFRDVDEKINVSSLTFNIKI